MPALLWVKNTDVGNIPDAKTVLASYLNIRDLLGFDKLVLPLPALDVLVQILG